MFQNKPLQKMPHAFKRFFSAAADAAPVKMAYTSYERSAPGEPAAAPPLVVMHGLFGSKTHWTGLCKAYHQQTSPQRKVVAVDARNHGESPHSPAHTYDLLASDLRALVERELRAGRAALMGHSMGGRAAMNCALKFPDFVEKLIVVDISPIGHASNFDSMPAVFLAMKSIALPQNVPTSVARRMVDKILVRFCPERNMRTFLLANLVKKEDGQFDWRINIDILLENFMNIATFAFDHKAKFTGPTLFIGGETSNFIPKRDHAAIKQLFPNSEIKYIPKTGHYVYSERPAEFMRVTLEFLNAK